LFPYLTRYAALSAAAFFPLSPVYAMLPLCRAGFQFGYAFVDGIVRNTQFSFY
jgi:hypothetical protein